MPSAAAAYANRAATTGVTPSRTRARMNDLGFKTTNAVPAATPRPAGRLPVFSPAVIPAVPINVSAMIATTRRRTGFPTSLLPSTTPGAATPVSHVIGARTTSRVVSTSSSPVFTSTTGCVTARTVSTADSLANCQISLPTAPSTSKTPVAGSKYSLK